MLAINNNVVKKVIIRLQCIKKIPILDSQSKKGVLILMKINVRRVLFLARKF